MKRFVALILVLLLTGLAGCSASQPGESLNGSAWTLSQLNGHSLLSGSQINIRFTADQFSGTAGCNQYGGSYQGRGGDFSTSPGVEMTAMGCLTPEGIMDQEQEFANALTSVTGYQINGGQLEMHNENGDIVLLFIIDQPANDVDPTSLTGSEWQVRTLDGDSLIPGSQITLQFVQNGEVNGFAGCRHFQATYLQTYEGIRFTSIGMTEEVCNDEALLLQEQDFTDYLSNAEHLEMIDGLLILSTRQGGEVVFEQVGE
ncbi:META domain-containing protein [bacterium]|nr:META domain-containing protein [bacterium]MCB2179130.1 META domain-containing protein [bacterium]